MAKAMAPAFQVAMFALLLALQLVRQAACYDEQFEKQLIEKYGALLEQIPEGERQEDEQVGWLKKLFSTNANHKPIDQMVEQFNKLNLILSNKLASLESDPEASVQQVAEWLKGAPEKRTILADVQQAASYLADLLATLEGGSFACNNGASRLFRLSAAFTGDKPTFDDPARRRRIDNIIRHFMLKHEQLCRQTYERRYDEIVAASGATTNPVGLIDKHFVVRAFGAKLDKMLAFLLTSGRDTLFESSREQVASELSRELEPKLTEPLDERSFGRLFGQLVRKPCESFVNATGPEVFEPVLFDFRLTNARLMTEQVNTEFGLGLGQYQVCQSILAQGEAFVSLCLRQLRSRASHMT